MIFYLPCNALVYILPWATSCPPSTVMNPASIFWESQIFAYFDKTWKRAKKRVAHLWSKAYFPISLSKLKCDVIYRLHIKINTPQLFVPSVRRDCTALKTFRNLQLVLTNHKRCLLLLVWMKNICVNISSAVFLNLLWFIAPFLTKNFCQHPYIGKLFGTLEGNYW